MVLKCNITQGFMECYECSATKKFKGLVLAGFRTKGKSSTSNRN
jgi:hypothetical protein